MKNWFLPIGWIVAGGVFANLFWASSASGQWPPAGSNASIAAAEGLPGTPPSRLTPESTPVTQATAMMPANASPSDVSPLRRSEDPAVQVGSAGEMMGFAGTGENGQTITLVDTSRSWMAVYHIAPNGEIRLVSSRPIDADFTIELNAIDPTPGAIRHATGR